MFSVVMLRDHATRPVASVERTDVVHTHPDPSTVNSQQSTMKRFGVTSTLLLLLFVLQTPRKVSPSRTWSNALASKKKQKPPLSIAFSPKRSVANEISGASLWSLSLRGGGASLEKAAVKVEAVGERTSSMTASVFNLVNNVAGAGILALSAAQAAGTGWIPSILFCSLLGAISARTFVMVGESCDMLKEKDFKVRYSSTPFNVVNRSVHLVLNLFA